MPPITMRAETSSSARKSIRPPSFDDVAAQDEPAVGDGGDEAEHGEQQGSLEVGEAIAVNAIEDQHGDAVHHKCVQREDTVSEAGSLGQAVEGQKHCKAEDDRKSVVKGRGCK